MNRGTIALMLGVVLASTAGCRSVSQVATGSTEPESSISTRFQPTKGSACLGTPATGDSAVMVEWVDFLRLHGIQYVAAPAKEGSVVNSKKVGGVIGRIACQLSSLKFHTAPGPAVDGDAAFLQVGTRVHALRGYPTSCRVVAREHGVFRVFLAQADASGRSKPVRCALGR